MMKYCSHLAHGTAHTCSPSRVGMKGANPRPHRGKRGGIKDQRDNPGGALFSKETGWKKTDLSF